MVIVALRSSYVVFGCVVIVSVAVLAAPLVGLTVHQSEARDDATSAVHVDDVVIVTCVVPPSLLNVGVADAVFISNVAVVFVGVVGVVGSGVGSSLPVEQPVAIASTARSASDNIFFILR
jgi:hypothetical protein